tara:strand:- start:6855 stop:7715 length:861 start_codon:yes stop_codon:yes gene_type:complete
MKALSLFLVILIGSTNLFAKNLSIGLIPGNGKEIRAQAEEFAKILGKQVDRKVDIFLPKNYQGLINAMKEKKVDFAFFTAMSFVYAEKQAGAKVLLKSVWDNPYYFSTIITNKGSKLQSLKDLHGKRIAFVDEKSTSGYLLPTLALKEKQINYEAVFSGNHKASIELLKKGKVDAVAVFANDENAAKGAWTVYYPEEKIEVQKLWISQSLPTDPFTVRQDFYEKNPQLTYDVMFSLMEMPKLNKDKNLLKETLGVTEVVVANSAQYEPIRKMVSSLEASSSPRLDM